MAIAIRYRCSLCAFDVVAWSDGNPYYLDERGEKFYAYHPDEKLEWCIGNDVPNICLTCGTDVKVDSRDPSRICPSCTEQTLVELTALGGKQCPKCTNGMFVADADFQVIS